MIPEGEQDHDKYLYDRHGNPVPKLTPAGYCTAHTYRPSNPWQCAVAECPGRLPVADRPPARGSEVGA